MASIYLINVGANTADAAKARSPLFPDGGFTFVSFPDENGNVAYPPEMQPFVSGAAGARTHLDPDWPNLTYGDFCRNMRARALLSATISDILLFWALLWKTPAASGDIWSVTEKGWFLIGALRIARILESSQTLDNLPDEELRRVSFNAHVRGNQVESRDKVRVFLGEQQHSARFAKAVDLGVYKPDSLLLQTVRTADGRQIRWNCPPRWNSVLRCCRAVLDLAIPEQRQRAEILRQRVLVWNPQFDLLEGTIPDPAARSA